MPIDKSCERCGQPFRVKPSHASQRFCTLVCKHLHEGEYGRENARVPTVNFICMVCSKPFSYKPSAVRAYQKKWGKLPAYCSTGCGGIGRRLAEDTWHTDCVQCGKRMPIQRRPGGTVNRKRHLCSTECRSLFRRLSYQKKHLGEGPTKHVARHGYIRMIVPGVDGSPSYEILEHRFVMQEKLDRKLYPEETVHHLDGNRQNNAPENLELFSSRHGPGQRVEDKIQFAIDMLRLYPEFARAAGVELREIEH